MLTKAVGHRYGPKHFLACLGISSRALGWKATRTPHLHTPHIGNMRYTTSVRELPFCPAFNKDMLAYAMLSSMHIVT